MGCAKGERDPDWDPERPGWKVEIGIGLRFGPIFCLYVHVKHIGIGIGIDYQMRFFTLNVPEIEIEIGTLGTIE